MDLVLSLMELRLLQELMAVSVLAPELTKVMVAAVEAAGTAVVRVNRLLLAATLKEVAAVLVMY